MAAIQTDNFMQHFQVAEYLTGRSGSSAEQFRRKELLLATKWDFFEIPFMIFLLPGLWRRSWWTCWTRTGPPCATPSLPWSSSQRSRVTSPTSPTPPTGLAPQPSLPPSQPSRTTLRRASSASRRPGLASQSTTNLSTSTQSSSFPPIWGSSRKSDPRSSMTVSTNLDIACW